jgi:hypothetical protein
MTSTKPRADRVQKAVIDLFLLGLAVQFFLAGLGVFGADDPGRPASASTFAAHRALGNALVLLAVVIAATSAATRRQVRGSLLLLLLVALQSVWAKAGSTAAIGALHVLGAFAITILALTMHRTAHRHHPTAVTSRSTPIRHENEHAV